MSIERLIKINEKLTVNPVINSLLLIIILQTAPSATIKIPGHLYYTY